MASRDANFVNRLRDTNTAFLEQFEELKGLVDQWNYLDMENTLQQTDVDMHDDIALVDVYAAMTTISALVTAMDGAHGPNLYKLRR